MKNKINNTNIFNKMLRKKVFFFSNYFIFFFWIILLLIIFLVYKKVFILDSPIKELHNILVYGDFFVVVVFLTSILLFLHYLINKIKDKTLDIVFGDKKDNNLNDNILEDGEVKNIKDDLLDRGKIVSDLVKIIEIDHNETFTIAIDGNWGDGKSTIINFVKEELSENNNFIFFDFDPWFYSNEKSIIEGFFEELQKKHGFLSESKFLKELITENSEKLLKFKLPFEQEGNIQKLKSKISKKLIYRKQKLIIIIDDIDRLSKPEEILEVLKIIGIFQKLQNIVFLVAFDRDVTETKLKDEIDRDKMYLEKLINFSFKIVTKQNNIDDYFIKSVEQGFVGKNKIIKDIKKVYFEDLSMPSYLGFDSNFIKTYWRFNTLREVKQFLNSFINTCKILDQEVNVGDLFRLIIFKTFYLKIYNDILNDKNFYIGGTFSKGSEMEDIDKKFIKKYINDLVKDSKDKGFVLDNIVNLFPMLNIAFDKYASISNEEDAERENRIFHKDYFHRYFLEELLDDEISDKFIINFIENWSSISLEVKKKLYSLNNKSYRSYLRKIKLNIERIKKDDHDIFIKENHQNLIEENNKGHHNYIEIALILFDLVDYAYENSFKDKSIQKKKLDKFIEIVNQSDNLYFANYFVDVYKHKSKYNEDFKKFIKKLKFKLYKRIEKKLFVDKEDIIKETKDIIHFTRLIKMNFENSNQDERIEKYLNRIFKKDLKYLVKLLELYFAREDVSGGFIDFTRLTNVKAIMDFVDNNRNDVEKLSKNDIDIVNKFTDEYKKYIKDGNK